MYGELSSAIRMQHLSQVSITHSLYCLSSPLLPILWHLLQLNVATTTPVFYVVHPLSFGSSLVT